MPGPDPFGIHAYEPIDGGFSVVGVCMRRVQGLLLRLNNGTWRCDYCGETIPIYRRSPEGATVRGAARKEAFQIVRPTDVV